MKFEVVSTETCEICGKRNMECIVLKRKVALIFSSETIVCQTCVSKMFRSFTKGA